MACSSREICADLYESDCQANFNSVSCTEVPLFVPFVLFTHFAIRKKNGTDQSLSPSCSVKRAPQLQTLVRTSALCAAAWTKLKTDVATGDGQGEDPCVALILQENRTKKLKDGRHTR